MTMLIIFWLSLAVVLLSIIVWWLYRQVEFHKNALVAKSAESRRWEANYERMLHDNETLIADQIRINTALDAAHMSLELVLTEIKPEDKKSAEVYGV